ncbi:MAG: LamG domain-containing protein, partial [Sphingopyxis sp.]
NGIWYLGNVTTNPIDRMSLDIKTDGSGSFFAESASTANLFTCTTAAGVFTTGVWFHVACVRSGNNLYIFKDGVQVATGTAIGTPVTTNVFQIGIARSGGAQRFLAGNMDEFRITKGVARYTAGFTAPTDQFGETTGAVLDDAWNPYLADPSLSFSNTNHTIVRPAGGNDTPDNSAVTTRARSYARVYAECTMNRDGGGWSGYFGFIDAGIDIAAISSENYTTGMQLAPSRNFLNVMRLVRNGDAGFSVSGSYASGVVVAVAIDITAGKAWIRADNDWITSAGGKTTTFDPNDPTITFTGGLNWRLFAMSPFSGTECTVNVGATAFARTPPSGFGAW